MLALALPLVGLGVSVGFCGQLFAGAAVGAAPLALAAQIYVWQKTAKKKYQKT